MAGRTRLAVTVTVVALVLALSAGLFAVQYAQAYAQCSSLPGSSPCDSVSGARVALDGLFVAVAGLMAALVMVISTGINWRTSPAPNTALALRIASEDEAFRLEQERRAQLAELNSMALAHVASQARARAENLARADSDAAASAEAAADAAILASLEPQWEEEPETEQVETPEQARARVVADRLKTLAKNRPDTVAEVISSWINQTRR